MHCNFGKSEMLTWYALRHGGESDPATDFVSVVGARDQIEQQSQRVFGWARNTALLGARWAKIA
jgi:hypothetical protein